MLLTLCPLLFPKISVSVQNLSVSFAQPLLPCWGQDTQTLAWSCPHLLSPLVAVDLGKSTSPGPAAGGEGEPVAPALAP